MCDCLQEYTSDGSVGASVRGYFGDPNGIRYYGLSLDRAPKKEALESDPCGCLVRYVDTDLGRVRI